MRAIVRIGFAVSKQATAVACAQSREQIIETDANEPGPMNKVHNRAYALADSYVRHCESLMNARLRRDQVGHSIILKADNRVSKFADSRERLSRPTRVTRCGRAALYGSRLNSSAIAHRY